MNLLDLEVWLLVLFHVTSVISWIGAHLFEAFILHVSFKKLSAEAKYEAYSTLLPRFNKITGLAAAGTILTGVMLSSALFFGDLLPFFTTAWGLLTLLSSVVLVIALLAPPKPSIISKMFSVAIGSAVLAAVAVLVTVAFTTDLAFLTESNSGLAIVTGGILAVLLFYVGASQGSRRVQIGFLSVEFLQSRRAGSQGGKDGESASMQDVLAKLQATEKKMLSMVLPENILAIIVIALMVYAANPF